MIRSSHGRVRMDLRGGGMIKTIISIVEDRDHVMGAMNRLSILFGRDKILRVPYTLFYKVLQASPHK
jgi:hypothetical protein